jgi:hypothetical protein
MRDFIEVDDVDSLRKALQSGFDPNSRDETELPWVVVAVRSDACKCLKLLLDSGASADGPRGETLSPLVVALKLGKRSCTELLLQAGADPNRLQAQKRTVLHIAAALKTAPIRELVAAGATLDFQDERGWTPLMVAAWDNRLESVEALIQSGCKQDLKEFAAGKTAYDLAEAAGYTQICSLLKSPTDGLCPQCKSNLIPPARFCTNCGYRVETASKQKKTPAPEPEPLPMQSKAPAQTGPLSQRLGLIGIVAIAVIAQGFIHSSSLSSTWNLLAGVAKSPPTPVASGPGTVAAASTPTPASATKPDWAGLWTGPNDRNGDHMEVVIDSNTLPCSGKVRGLYPGDAEFTASVTWTLKPGTDNVLEGKQSSDGETQTVAVARWEDSRLWGQARLVKPTVGPDGKLQEASMTTLDIDGYRRQ